MVKYSELSIVGPAMVKYSEISIVGPAMVKYYINCGTPKWQANSRSRTNKCGTQLIAYDTKLIRVGQQRNRGLKPGREMKPFVFTPSEL
jgi:hypothetical protein